MNIVGALALVGNRIRYAFWEFERKVVVEIGYIPWTSWAGNTDLSVSYGTKCCTSGPRCKGKEVEPEVAEVRNESCHPQVLGSADGVNKSPIGNLI